MGDCCRLYGCHFPSCESVKLSSACKVIHVRFLDSPSKNMDPFSGGCSFCVSELQLRAKINTFLDGKGDMLTEYISHGVDCGVSAKTTSLASP